MASSEFNFGTPNYLESDLEADWPGDSSQFIWDSPQPDLPSGVGFSDGLMLNVPQPSQPPQAPSPAFDVAPSVDKPQGRPVQTKTNTKKGAKAEASKVAFASESSPSEASSHSSSSASSAQRKRKAAAAPLQNQTGSFLTSITQDDQATDQYKVDKLFGNMDDAFAFDDTAFPNMGAGMDNLSLGTLGANSIPQDFSTLR